MTWKLSVSLSKHRWSLSQLLVPLPGVLALVIPMSKLQVVASSNHWSYSWGVTFLVRLSPIPQPVSPAFIWHLRLSVPQYLWPVHCLPLSIRTDAVNAGTCLSCSLGEAWAWQVPSKDTLYWGGHAELESEELEMLGESGSQMFCKKTAEGPWQVTYSCRSQLQREWAGQGTEQTIRQTLAIPAFRKSKFSITHITPAHSCLPSFHPSVCPSIQSSLQSSFPWIRPWRHNLE
jgi:hypothetical protein